jgi:bis(5'-nucleosyl)-tetraphosphatase (symmetrical)
MVFLIGDVQGCADVLDRALAEIGFSASRDRLIVLGDLVNRGPDSLGVLRRLATFGDAATCLLGNHDLHLLAVAHGLRQPHRNDTFADVLDDPRQHDWTDWLRQRPLACMAEGWLCVHAGVVPQWNAATTLALAAEVQATLRSPDLVHFLAVMYGNEPACWNDQLIGEERLRFIVNALTRIRFCTDAGELDFKTKDGAGAAPPGYRPWFEVPGRATVQEPVAFGHWSTLGLIDQPLLLGLDTGCVWGGALTVARIDGGRRDLHQVPCPAAQTPGT